jgi:hypothetical protein
VARNLRPGGYFVGIVPDGLQINETIRTRPVFDDGHMRVQALWHGKPSAFGSQYTCSITKTVTEGSDIAEYLVYGNVLDALARISGFRAVSDANRAVQGLQQSVDGTLYRLNPPYGDPEARCSTLYAAFVFQKV